MGKNFEKFGKIGKFLSIIIRLNPNNYSIKINP